MSTGAVLFDFVRHWSRRAGPLAERGRLVALLAGIESLAGRGKGASVGALAADIGIDQSGTSRLVREAREAGYLVTRPAPHDARGREAHLTGAGWALLAEARAWQEEVFLELSAGWSEARRREFRGAMLDLVAASRARE